MSFTSLVGQPLPLSCEGLAHQTSLLHDFIDSEVYDFSDGFTTHIGSNFLEELQGHRPHPLAPPIIN